MGIICHGLVVLVRKQVGNCCSVHQDRAASWCYSSRLWAHTEATHGLCAGEPLMHAIRGVGVQCKNAYCIPYIEMVSIVQRAGCIGWKLARQPVKLGADPELHM